MLTTSDHGTAGTTNVIPFSRPSTGDTGQHGPSHELVLSVYRDGDGKLHLRFPQSLGLFQRLTMLFGLVHATRVEERRVMMALGEAKGMSLTPDPTNEYDREAFGLEKPVGRRRAARGRARKQAALLPQPNGHNGRQRPSLRLVEQR